jgi:hypothetical protein
VVRIKVDGRFVKSAAQACGQLRATLTDGGGISHRNGRKVRWLWWAPGQALRQCDFVVYGTILEHSGNPHFVRFEPEG